MYYQYICDIWGGEISLRWVQFDLLAISGEASPTFGHANANFSVFIDRIRNQFVKTKCRAGFATARYLLRWFGGSEFWQWARGFVHMGNNNSVKRIAAALGGRGMFFWVFCVHRV